MNKVLLPTDGSQSALSTASYVADIAKRIPGLEVTVLSVEDDEVQGDRAIKSTKEIFEQAGITVKTIINKGSEEVANIIIYYANNGPYDHIFIGRRGLNIVQDLLIGGISKKVVKKAKIPVTVVPAKVKK